VKNLKLIIIVVLIIAAILATAMLPVGDYLERFLDWVEGLGVWAPLVAGAFYIPATVLFVPGSLVTLAIGAIFGVVVGTIVVSLGSILGSTAAFLIGRFFARDWVAAKVAASPRFKAIDDAVARSGFKIVLLTRLSPVFPYNLLGYMYGITQVKLRDYFFASWIGMFPGTVMYVYLGYALGEAAMAGERDKTVGEYVLIAVGLVATIAVTVVITKIARNALREATGVADDPAAQGATTDA